MRFQTEFASEAVKRAALNHSGTGPYAEQWSATQGLKSSNMSPADVNAIPIVKSDGLIFLKRQLNAALETITTKAEAVLVSTLGSAKSRKIPMLLLLVLLILLLYQNTTFCRQL